MNHARHACVAALLSAFMMTAASAQKTQWCSAPRRRAAAFRCSAAPRPRPSTRPILRWRSSRATPKAAPRISRCSSRASSISPWWRASRPMKRSRASGARPTNLKIVTAIYSNPGMFVVRGDSAAKSLRDLLGKPVAWGTRASGLTLLARYVLDGLGLDREKDFSAVYLERAGDGPAMVLDGRVAALWGGGIGWPGFTAVMQAGGRFIGLERRGGGAHPRQAQFPQAAYSAGRRLSRAERSRSHRSGRGASSWRGRRSTTTRLSLGAGAAPRARRTGQTAGARPRDHAAEYACRGPKSRQIHPGVQRYLREIGLMR